MDEILPSNSLFVAIWRFIGLFFLILSALLVMLFLYPFLGEEKRFEYLRKWSARMMNIFHFKIVVKGEIPKSFKGALIMANHVSWLDIFALNYIYPIRFIAKLEIRKWPIIGAMVARAGTVFINRADRKDAVRISQNIATCLTEGGTVALFPESTTTDGFRILPLKAALFESAITAKKKVYPVALLYYDERYKRSTLPSYEGETTLFQSLCSIMKKMRGGYIEVIFSHPIDAATGCDRYALSQQTQKVLEKILLENSPEITIVENQNKVDEKAE